MKLAIEPVSAADLAEIGTWIYGPPYELYDRAAGGDVKNPERYYAARDEDGTLVGFYYFEEQADALEYGLGLRPELTGRGLGLEFVEAGLDYARERFQPGRITLSVAAFNDRARIVYERAGFTVVGRHVRRFDRWGAVEFVDMEEA